AIGSTDVALARLLPSGGAQTSRTGSWGPAGPPPREEPLEARRGARAPRAPRQAPIEASREPRAPRAPCRRRLAPRRPRELAPGRSHAQRDRSNDQPLRGARDEAPSTPVPRKARGRISPLFPATPRATAEASRSPHGGGSVRGVPRRAV